MASSSDASSSTALMGLLASALNPDKEDVRALIFNQRSFMGGMNQLLDSSRLQDNEYYLLVNGRNRYDTIKPIKRLRQVNDCPKGANYQGCYSAGQFLVVFVDGRAFYKNLDTDSAFNQIAGFQMDGSVPFIYAELVPASTVNHVRVQVNAELANGPVNLTTKINGSIQCLVCQDGVNQPWVIFDDGTARASQNFSQWENNDSGSKREYVPIGTLMKYSNGILYIVNDKQILRSVTGRPLDFVIVVDIDGNKVDEQDAFALAYSVSNETITCLALLNDPNGSVYVGTANNSYAIAPDFNNLIYGEPTFDSRFLFNTGPLNNFAFIDVNGDFAFTDFNGLRSFNAVQQFRTEGRNSAFSAKVARLFENILQTTPVGVSFDDYGLFAVRTRYGNAVLVFDTLLQTYSAIDLFSELDGTIIKQFCQTKTLLSRRLFFITEDSRLFEYYGAPDTETVKFYPSEWCSNDPKTEQKPDFLHLVMTDVVEGGEINVVPFTDKKKQTASSKTINDVDADAVSDAQSFPLAGDFDNDLVKNIVFPLDEVNQGWKVGFLITWNFNAVLSHIRLQSTKQTGDNSDEAAADMV